MADPEVMEEQEGGLCRGHQGWKLIRVDTNTEEKPHPHTQNKPSVFSSIIMNVSFAPQLVARQTLSCSHMWVDFVSSFTVFKFVSSWVSSDLAANHQNHSKNKGTLLSALLLPIGFLLSAH